MNCSLRVLSTGLIELFSSLSLATASGSEKNDFLQEIETMKCVAKGNNPHVVNMIGCVTIQEPLCLITEFVKHGDLLSYLQSIRKTVLHYTSK